MGNKQPHPVDPIGITIRVDYPGGKIYLKLAQEFAIKKPSTFTLEDKRTKSTTRIVARYEDQIPDGQVLVKFSFTPPYREISSVKLPLPYRKQVSLGGKNDVKATWISAETLD